MKTKFLMAAALLVAMGGIFYGFVGRGTNTGSLILRDDTRVGNATGYEYVTIVQTELTLNVSGTNLEYQWEKNKLKSGLDFSLALKKVQEFETQGWELVENTVAGEAATRNYFLLRKKRE